MSDKATSDKTKEGLLKVMQRLEATFGGKQYTDGEKVVWYLELEGGTAGYWTQEILEIAASLILEGESTMLESKFKPSFIQFKFYIGQARNKLAAKKGEGKPRPWDHTADEKTISNEQLIEKGVRVVKNPYTRVKLLATQCYTTGRMDKKRWDELQAEADAKRKTGEDMTDTIEELKELAVVKFVMLKDEDGKEFKKYVGGRHGKNHTT